MSKLAKALIKCDDGVRSSMARWESPQHEKTTELDHLMELQAGIERNSHRLGLQKWQSLCAQRLCGELCAVRLFRKSRKR